MFTNTNSLTDYVTQLFSRLNESQIQHTVDLYSSVPDLPNVLSQAEAIMGESGLSSGCILASRADLSVTPPDIFICPTYFVLQAFGNVSWKVSSLRVP